MLQGILLKNPTAENKKKKKSSRSSIGRVKKTIKQKNTGANNSAQQRPQGTQLQPCIMRHRRRKIKPTTIPKVNKENKHEMMLLWTRTCLTESAISGPMPSPGNRVARIGVVADAAAADEKARVEKSVVDWRRRARPNTLAAIERNTDPQRQKRFSLALANPGSVSTFIPSPTTNPLRNWKRDLFPRNVYLT